MKVEHKSGTKTKTAIFEKHFHTLMTDVSETVPWANEELRPFLLVLGENRASPWFRNWWETAKQCWEKFNKKMPSDSVTTVGMRQKEKCWRFVHLHVDAMVHTRLDTGKGRLRLSPLVDDVRLAGHGDIWKLMSVIVLRPQVTFPDYSQSTAAESCP